MQTAIPAFGTTCQVQRLFPAAAILLLLLAVFAQPAMSQNQLALANNYFVTGDYVVGGVGLRGLGSGGLATGTINIPDSAQAKATGVPSLSVPPGADIVAAFLYWETVESSLRGAATGQQGFFNGYAITGTIRGDPNAPTSWSTGGCSGSAQGSKTMRVYRADVRPYLNLDANGNIVGNGSYVVQLADSGSNGGGVPLTLGASLVIIYRVQSPNVALNSIALYDGALAPNNSNSTMTLPIQGFYDAATSPVAKITHIVGNGQPNKTESVFLNSVTLPSLYHGLPPFPGIYNGSWDSPTWVTNSYGSAVQSGDSSETASVVPAGSGSGCVNWGAVVFSTTVQNSDNDGLLDVWKKNQGYTDVNTNQWVALPDAVPGQQDLFIELDYLSNLDGSAGKYLHSHLPKRAALDAVGKAFSNRGIHAHFDLGPGIYGGDPYVIPYPVQVPMGATTFPGAGGNAISEGLLVCSDGTTLCAFPGQATVGWKGGVGFVQTQTTLGNFQPGRKDSYHYVLFGHGLGAPRTYWSTVGSAPILAGSGIATLVSIAVKSNVATVMLSSPPFVVRPGDAACTEASCKRVTVEGALQAANASLNGTYAFVNASSTPSVNTVASTTTFTIQTSGVPDGTYNFNNEPQLGLTYGGPTSDSGFSDVGGGDSAVTFGLWSADDAANCQADPTKVLSAGQAYCTDQVGTVTAEAGTLLHELGHTFFLGHGGTFYPNGTVVNGPLAGQQGNFPLGQPSFGLNCNPAFLSSMNYLFQIRGFPNGGIDYSGQTLPTLSENTLTEGPGIGSDVYTGALAAHLTRWYALPNALDVQLQSSVGGRFVSFHCDGSPITDGAQMVRVEGNAFIPSSNLFSAPIDWNHNLVLDASQLVWQDINFNGSTSGSPDTGLQGFNDWVNLDLRQMGARADAFGLSGGSGSRFGGGGSRFGGGGSRVGGGGSRFGGGGSRFGGGGTEQDTDTANSTADAPIISGAAMSGHSVLVSWTAPEFGQFRSYSVWRAAGTFTSLADVFAHRALFTNVGTVTKPTPPATSFLDGTVKNNTTYTYFVVDTNKQGAQSAPSGTAMITVKF